MNGQQKHVYEFGSFQLDPLEHTLLHDGKIVSLTPKVFDTLLILIENNGHLVEKDELLEKVWSDTIVEEANLAKNISILRKVFSKHGLGDSFIETVPKRGYRFTAEVKEIESENSQTSEKMFQPDSFQNSKTKIALIASILFISAFAVGYYFYSNLGNTAPLTDKDVILLIDFENKTGEDIFDGTLRQGLIMQLQQSPFLSVFPDEQARNTLELMKRSPDEKITRELGKEICQRNGLKAYIAGTITKLGNIYVVGLETVNSQTGEIMALTQEEAESKEKVLKTLSVAATEMRQKLGESLAQIRELNKPLDVTTSSLEALQSFAMAKESAIKGNHLERIQHIKRAIEIDPDFASAYVSLSTGYWNTSQYELAEVMAAKAFELREGVSEFEKLVISHTYYSNVTWETDKSIEVLKILRKKYPRIDWIPNNLSHEYRMSGNYEKALEESITAVKMHPKTANNYGNLAYTYVLLNRYDEAKKIVEESFQNNLESGSLRSTLYNIAFIKNDNEEMRNQVELMSGKPEENGVLRSEAETAAFRGQWKKSMKLFSKAALIAEQNDFKELSSIHLANQALTASVLGQCSQAQTSIDDALKIAATREVNGYAMLVFAKCGDISRSQLVADELQEKYPKDTRQQKIWIPVNEAIISLNKGNAGEAIKLLETVGLYERASFYWVHTVRGEAYLALNEQEKAGTEYQKILDHRGWSPVSLLYPLAQLGKARATKDAREYEKFFEMWKDADEDLSILIEAKKEYENLK